MLLRRNRLLVSLLVLSPVLGWFGAADPCRAAFINLTPTVGFNSIDSVPLSDLVTGAVEGITVGDKDFHSFSYSRIGDMPPPEDINVLGFRDPDGNWGISFHGGFHDMPGGGISDALIRYIVELDPAFVAQLFRINDAHLFVGGIGVGANSVITVDESFLGTNETLHAFMSSIGQGGTQLSDGVVFDQLHTKLHVTKDIFVFAHPDAILPARVTVIDQSFSQIIIPEPATVWLTAVGLVALTGYLRRRRR